MNRYPGAPNDTGTVHPIIEAVMASDHERAIRAFSILAEVNTMFSEAMTQVEGESDVVSMEQVPAYDRLTDLAIIGLMVERGIFHTMTEGMMKLAETPCESFPSRHSCADEGSGKSPDAEPGADRYCFPCLFRHILGGGIVTAKGR